MSSYKINYEQLRQQPEIADMLSALQRGLEKFGIDFYLVGAVARDVWMCAINKIAPRRTTGDIDFAELFARIERILNANTDDMPNSKMAAIMIEYFQNTMEDSVLLLQQLKQGFTE